MPRVLPWRIVCAGGALLAATLALVPWTPAGPRSVRYQKRRASGVPVNVITVNLRDPSVKVAVALARGGLGRREAFPRMVTRVRPAAALTGTFFGVRNAWPTGDIVIDGHWIARGFAGTAVAVTPDNRVRLLPARRGSPRRWGKYDMVLGGGPRLLTRGRITLAPRAEGFRDRSLFARRPRTAVGVTRQGKLLLVSVRRPIYLRRLARIMRSLGARDAVAMDGGGSTAMFYRGRFVSRPARRLTNLLVVYDNRRAYAAARWRLAPRALLAGRPAPTETPAEPTLAATIDDTSAVTSKEMVLEETSATAEERAEDAELSPDEETAALAAEEAASPVSEKGEETR